MPPSRLMGWCAPAQSQATFSMIGTVQDQSQSHIPFIARRMRHKTDDGRQVVQPPGKPNEKES
jgi:hypothetical protein